MNNLSKPDKEEDIRYMRIALEYAKEAYKKGEVPIGCVIVSHGHIVGHAHNMTEQLQDVTAHAEILSITAAESYLGGKYLPDCTLYVTVEPCVMCAGAIGWAQISRLVYGAKDDKRGFSRFAPQALHPKCSISSGILEEECQELMQHFFQEKR